MAVRLKADAVPGWSPATVTPPGHLRVLGIDPGSRSTGLGVVEQVPSGALRAIDSQVIVPQAEDPALRLQQIYTGVADIIARHKPHQATVEQVFMARNARAALVLGEARGVAVCAAACAGLPVTTYSARHIKQAVVGYGAADKVQVQHMVRALLGLSVTPPPDAADALACAICHIHALAAAHSSAWQEAEIAPQGLPRYRAPSARRRASLS